MSTPADVTERVRPGHPARRRRRVLVAAAAALALGAGSPAIASAAAPATGPACGDVVEGHVVLTADLVCPRGAIGLTVVSGATLDLGGHRLVGGGHGAGVAVPGIGDATVRNGVVVGWAVGIAVGRDSQSPGPQGVVTLDRTTVRGNDLGIELLGPADVGPEIRVTSSRVADNGVGIRTGPAGRTWVTSSRVVGNVMGAQIVPGAWLSLVDSVVIRNSTGLRNESHLIVNGGTLRENGTAVACVGGGSRVERATIAGNDLGVDCGSGAGLDLVDSVLRGNGTAVRLDGSFATIVANRLVGNGIGFVAGGPHGNARLESNEFRRNGDGVLADFEWLVLVGNTVVRNERWGIHAPGAVDLGGNTAWGNGNEPQCVGVVCSRPDLS